MSIRPFFLATIFAYAGLQQGFEIGAAETVFDGTSPAATHSRSSAPKRLPSRTLSALGTATRVAQIDDAFPATNDPGSIRPQAKATAVSRARQSRAAVAPSSAALAVVNAAEPRPAAPAAPAMKPFVDSQVMAASYSAPIHSAEPTTLPRIETAQNSENPLRNTVSTSATSRITTLGPSSQNTSNPLR